ncbi:unnamed protein product [Closterium sp. NIES-54]
MAHLYRAANISGRDPARYQRFLSLDPSRLLIPPVARCQSPHPSHLPVPPSFDPLRRRITSVDTTLSSLPLSRRSIPPLSYLFRLPPPHLPPSFPSDTTSSTSTFFLPFALISLAARPTFPYPRPSLPPSPSVLPTRPLRRPRFSSHRLPRRPHFVGPSSVLPPPVFRASSARMPCFLCPSSLLPLPVALLFPVRRSRFPSHRLTRRPRFPCPSPSLPLPCLARRPRFPSQCLPRRPRFPSHRHIPPYTLPHVPLPSTPAHTRPTSPHLPPSILPNPVFHSTISLVPSFILSFASMLRLVQGNLSNEGNGGMQIHLQIHLPSLARSLPLFLSPSLPFFLSPSHSSIPLSFLHAPAPLPPLATVLFLPSIRLAFLHFLPISFPHYAFLHPPNFSPHPLYLPSFIPRCLHRIPLFTFLQARTYRCLFPLTSLHLLIYPPTFPPTCPHPLS